MRVLVVADDREPPVVRDQVVPGPLLADAQATARACPKLALRLDPGH